MRPAILMTGDRTEHGTVVSVEAMDWHGLNYRVQFRRDNSIVPLRFRRGDDIRVSALAPPILVGEQHSLSAPEGLRAFEGPGSSGDRLRRLLGPDRPLSGLSVVNLLPSGGWDRGEARAAADWLLESVDADRWLLAGRRVADGFGLLAPYLAWRVHRGRLMAVVPHPSGRNRYWNDPANTDRAGRFLRGAVARQ